jgi:lipopolysaccharide/colanic/teichoic acid biosynthesis glycosyltransferase
MRTGSAPDAERLTTLGNFLRQTSIDELPEFWNVLKGEMSIVGPRPLRMHYLHLYNDEQATRHDMQPGLTGLAQVEGRNELSWEDRFERDVWYIRNWSLALDFKIIARTIGTVIRRTGVTPQGAEVLHPFSGKDRD